LLSVNRLDSQPLLATPSQSPKFAAHAATVHVPPVHAGIAFGRLQACPHMPQFARSVLVFAHPLAQQVVPVLHGGPPAHPITTHVPPMQLEPVAHAWPQVPQFALSVFRFDSQPFAAEPSQLPKPVLHVGMHIAAAQLTVSFGPVAHRMPQPPQLSASVVVLTQVFEQQTSPVGHGSPEEHPVP
jgi:hypothetical protein